MRADLSLLLKTVKSGPAKSRQALDADLKLSELQGLNHLN